MLLKAVKLVVKIMPITRVIQYSGTAKTDKARPLISQNYEHVDKLK